MIEMGWMCNWKGCNEIFDTEQGLKIHIGMTHLTKPKRRADFRAYERKRLGKIPTHLLRDLRDIVDEELKKR
jgi:hypothetical protein